MDRRIKEEIEKGETVLGIELGSTRIKAVLIDSTHHPIASGSYVWENRFEEGIWTYHLEDIWQGIQIAFLELSKEVRRLYAVDIVQLNAIGISAMMHGYMPFDKNGRLLTPFRTWRNTNTKQAAEELTKELEFNIPLRWSVAHLYQAIINEEKHVRDICYLTTLAGFVHWQLTGEHVLGIGDASGMFPIDNVSGDFDEQMLARFDKIAERNGFHKRLKELLPKVLSAGDIAGILTKRGAQLLDPSGKLQAGIPLCPPEGDAGTGMVATNSVAEHTGNVSAGTSIFSMAVLEKPLSKVYPELDVVTTPTGKPVAMVHCNNCTTDLDAWVRLFSELLERAGCRLTKSRLYDLLYQTALEGESDCGGVLSCNYVSGEPITGFDEGVPFILRSAEAKLTIGNLMRSFLFSAIVALRIGMDILTEQENVQLKRICGHGGMFKTERVGQQLMAAALKTPVVVLESAGEGGAWGIALLASYVVRKEKEETLERYLEKEVFTAELGEEFIPLQKDIIGFEVFSEHLRKMLSVEQLAIEKMSEK